MANTAITYEDTWTNMFNDFIARIERPGLNELVEHLKEINFFLCPSSSQYHGAEEGGNLKHSVLVTETILDLRQAIAPQLSEESCILVGLFHDIGKASYYNKPLYIENTLKGGKRSGSKPFKSNPDRLSIPHQVVSLHIISKFMQLTEHEVFAILYHNGLYTPDGRNASGKETPLMLLLHWADMWTSRVLEVEESENLFYSAEVF